MIKTCDKIAPRMSHAVIWDMAYTALPYCVEWNALNRPADNLVFVCSRFVLINLNVLDDISISYTPY